jgi:hypothetical protein
LRPLDARGADYPESTVDSSASGVGDVRDECYPSTSIRPSRSSRSSSAPGAGVEYRDSDDPRLMPPSPKPGLGAPDVYPGLGAPDTYAGLGANEGLRVPDVDAY